MRVELQGICKSFKGKKILDEVCLTVENGACVGILGENGCGKSTLLSILAGVQKADSGKFLCDGVDLFKNRDLRNSILGYVPQEDPLIEELNALDNLRMWYDKNTLKAQLESGVLSMLGMEGFLKTPVGKLSGGMKKRLSIGCAVASNPKILLLDEPSANLDLICKDIIYNYLKNFKASGGIVFLATHDLQEMTLCDGSFIIKQGTLVPYHFDGDLHRLVECLK